MKIDARWQDAALHTQMNPRFAAFTGAFGGWTAALAVHAAERLAPQGMRAVSLSMDFQRGIRAGEVQATPTLDRAGRNVAFTRVEVTQDGIAATASVALARHRDTDPITVSTMPHCTPPETLEPLHFPVADVTWVGEYDMRAAIGRMLQPNEALRTLVWTRRSDGAVLDLAGLFAICDASIPRIFFHYSEPSTIATVSMSIYRRATVEQIESVGDDFVLIEANCDAAGNGFFDHRLNIWSRSGILLGTSTQLASYKVTPASAAASQ